MTETIKIEKHLVEKSRANDINISDVVFGRVYSDHMFVAEYVNGEWGGFKIEPYQSLSFTPGASILHYAQSVFEGMKAYKNDQGDILVFRPDMNQRRLNISAERICIPELPEEVFMDGLTELLKVDRDWIPSKRGTSLYIRPFIFATDEYIGLKPSDTYKFIICTCPVGAYYSKPVKVKVETHFTRAVEGGTGYAKTGGNYAASLYPAKLAMQEGYDQLIWTDGKKHEFVEEAGTMNLMFVINDTLITSATGDSVLKGITRDSVLTLAKDMGMKVEERRVSISEIIEAAQKGSLKEAFGTGTAATIAQIELIGHDGIDYKLPPVETRTVSNKILQELDNIKYGVTQDTRGWVYKV